MEKNLHAEMQSYIKNIRKKKRWILPIKIYITLEYTRIYESEKDHRYFDRKINKQIIPKNFVLF